MKDNARMKVFFVIMVLGFMSFIVVGQIVYANDYIFDIYQYLTVGKLNPDMYKNSSVSFSDDNVIILRLDDVGPYHYDSVVRDIVAETTTRKLPIVLGVIPRDLNKDKTFLNWAHSNINNPYIEFAMHGYSHSLEEFQNYTEEEAYSNLVLGKESMMENLRVVPVTFIPPYNDYSEGTVAALERTYFKVMSAKENEMLDSNILYRGYNAETYDFGKVENIPVEKTVADCQNSLDANGICVVMIHPQDYMTLKEGNSQRELDPVKYQEFLKLLDELQKLDAKFGMFKDRVSLQKIS